MPARPFSTRPWRSANATPTRSTARSGPASVFLNASASSDGGRAAMSLRFHLPAGVVEEAAYGRRRFVLDEGPDQTLEETGHRRIRGDRLREADPRRGLA